MTKDDQIYSLNIQFEAMYRDSGKLEMDFKSPLLETLKRQTPLWTYGDFSAIKPKSLFAMVKSKHWKWVFYDFDTLDMWKAVVASFGSLNQLARKRKKSR